MQEARPRSLTEGLDAARAGAEAYELARRLFPLPRSLTGHGVRETLRLVGEVVPLEVTEVPSGTPIFDWTVPREWNLADAWIADASGRRIVDARASNLHVLGYSRPIRETLTGAELAEHLHSLPEHPDWIPYRTAYWADTWGFCVSERQRAEIRPDERYEVVIDATLEDGHLTYGEALLPGESDEEVMLTTYVCHPSVANDNVSGIALLAVLGGLLAARPLRRTHRLLFSPGTVGPLAWLSRNLEGLPRIHAGAVVACVGDSGPIRYKRSRRGDAPVDRAAAHVLRHTRPDALVEDFVPWGGDERQFCSPGFNLPVGAFTRTPHGLYREISAGVPREDEAFQRALMWVLNQADGTRSLLDTAERAELPFGLVADAADALLEAELLE